MRINIKNKQVEVVDEGCRTRRCFMIGQDKGSYTPGRGYTSYREKPIWVCMRRHLHGCPSAGTCQKCNTMYLEAQVVCGFCGAQL